MKETWLVRALTLFLPVKSTAGLTKMVIYSLTKDIHSPYRNLHYCLQWVNKLRYTILIGD